jgi:DNA-binding NarL/FixJ family response regulator
VTRARVVIADDHPFLLDGLVTLLKDRFDVVATVTDGHQLLDAAARLRPDVIITDISMPGLNGLEAFARLKAAGAAAKVIVLTQFADPELAAAAMALGASGFVVKMLAANELIRAVEQVLLGLTYLSLSLRADT